MIKKVKLAKINLTMQTGRIVRWLKKEGDRVERDEPLLEVETDKAVNTVESFYSGYVKKILVAEGEEVPVDALIAYVGDLEDEVPAEPLPDEAARMAAAGEGAPAAQQPGLAGQQSAPAAAARGGVVTASPFARRLAAELGVDLATVTGSGPDGRIGKEDVLAASGRGKASTPSAPGVQSVPLSRLKKLTAERMKSSYLEAPHISLDLSVRVRTLEALRARLNAGKAEAERYSLTDLLARSVSLALETNPLLNAAFKDGEITAFREQGIGIAVASPSGLVVPVIQGCQLLNLAQIRDRRRELVARAREGRQTVQDLAGGTFTMTNLGMYGVEAFRPILYPGQAGILAVGAVRHLALADAAGNLSAEPVMQLTLGCDHRVVDGVEGAMFLRRLKELLEQPEALAGGRE